MRNSRHLKDTLDRLYSEYVQQFKRSPSEFFENRRDPVLFPHRYSEFGDIEASAFIAATFAYGNVTSLCAFIDRLLALLQPTPHAFLRQGPDAVAALADQKPYYRLHKTPEILAVLTVLSDVYSSGATLYDVFRQSYDRDNIMYIALSDFVANLRKRSTTALKFLLPSPQDGSTCKRLHLFLRWMVRRDGIDFGLWRDISPAHLIMPVDTHIGRTAYRLGWIETPSLGWKKAEQITDVLRRFNAEDPTRYDFALCHESIAKSEWLSELIAGKRQRVPVAR
jgi:uncharacterized protein (TIGR02757 family)